MLQFLSKARQVQRAASFSKILFLLLALALIGTHSFTFMGANINVSPNLINTTATYTINLLRQYDQLLGQTAWSSNPLASTDNVTITFPEQFDASLIVNAICTDVSVNTVSVAGFSCIAQSSSIVISNLFTDGSLVTEVNVILDGITNPAIALTTSALIGSIGNDVTASSSSMTFSAAELAGLVVSFNGLVNQTSDMIYQIKLSNSIPLGGIIKIQFPPTLLWAREISSTHIIPINQALSCYGITSQINNSTIQCAGDLNSKMITVSSAFSRKINSGQTVKFAISGLHAPPSTEAVDVLVVSTHDGSSNKIDYKNATISGLQPQILQNFKVRSTLATFGVNNNVGGLTFTFTLSDTLSYRDTFAIYLPTTSVVNLQQSTSSFSLVTSASTYSNYTVSCQQQTTNPNYNSGTLGNLTFIKFKAPPSTKATAPISFVILLNGYPRMIGSASISAVQNNYTLTVSSNSLIVNTYASFSFAFTMTDVLTSSAYFVLILDPLLSTSTTQKSNILSNLTVSISSNVANGIKTSPSTQIVTVNGSYQLKLSSLNTSSANIGVQTITITVNNLLNPAAVTTLTSFQISTYYSSSDDLVANAKYTGSIVLQPGAITLSVPTSTSSTTYTFSTVSIPFTNQNPIPTQGYLLLSLPKELSLLALCQTSISISGLTVSSTSTNFMSNNSILIKTDTIISESSAIYIAITNLLSPNSTRPTSTFALSSYDASFAAIDISSNSVSLTVPSGNAFNSFTISRSNQQCLSSSNYTLTFQQIQNASNVSVISITFNNLVSKSGLTNIYELVYNSNTGVTVENSLSFSDISANEIRVTLSQNSTSTHQIVLKTIMNPPSLAPASQTILLKSLTSDGLYLYSEMFLDPIQNTITSSARIADWYFSNIALGEASKLTLSLLAPTNWDNIVYSVAITIPTAFADASNASCQSSLSGLTCSYSPVTRLLRINLLNSSFLPSPLNFNITLVNPTVGDPQIFEIQTYDSDVYGVQSDASTVVFGNNCTAPCRTCETNDTSSCLSCYSNGNSSLFYNNHCFSECPNGSYQTNKTCTSCLASCLTCSQINDNCTSCNTSSSFSLFFSNSISGKAQCLTTCPVGEYNLSYICTPCDSTCSSCDIIGCLTCQSGLYLYNYTCIATCPDTTYLSNLTCLACSSNCSTCLNTSSSCTSCPAFSFLYNFTCYSSCPNTNMFVTINQTCQFCSLFCETCQQDASNCTSCTPNSTLPLYFNGTCRSDCPELYYSATNSCLLCANLGIGCQNCSSPTTCKSCDIGLYLFDVNSSCLSIAPTGYLIINSTIQSCSNNCSACSLLPDNCTMCSGNLSLSNNLCLTTCPNGTVSINNSCTTCTSPCQTCTNTTSSCSSCLSNSSKFLTGSSCVDPTLCPAGTYANTTTMECSVCISPCVTCNSFTQCIACIGNYSFLASNSSCVDTCPSGQLSKIVNSSLTCVFCLYPCQSCANTTSTCLSCLSNSSLFLSGSSCVTATACSNGTYANTTTQSCTTCISSCSSCSTINNCSLCSTGFYLDVPTAACTNNCSAGTVGTFNTTSSRNECLPCLSPCATCSSSTTHCLSCSNTTFLINGTCVNSSSCPSGTFGNTTSGSCDSCISPCLTCNNQTYCKSCQTDYYLSNNTCMQFCPNGTYVVNSSGIITCFSCSSSCLGCSLQATRCTSCSNGTFLTNQTCVSSSLCPNGTFANNNESTCKACQSPCSQCSSLANCTSCNSSTYLYSLNASCLSTCPNGTLIYQGQCQTCSSSCQTCSISTTNCTSCSNDTFYTNGSCVNSTSCPNGTYANSSSSSCQSCVAPCFKCQTLSACTSCQSGYYILNSSCVTSSSCPNGTIAVNSSTGGECLSCSSPCLTCSGSITKCLSCLQNGSEPLFLINNTCVPSSLCPNGSYANSTILSCSSCSSLCFTCNNTATECSSCTSGYFLSSTNNTCISSCPSGSVAITSNRTCTNCSSICLSCSTSTTNCTSCKTGQYKYNSTCLTTCPADLIPDPANQVCLPCSSTCATCINTVSNCTGCSSPRNLYNNTCISTCPNGYFSETNRCNACASICNTCSSISYCLTCHSPMVAHLGGCLISCPSNSQYNISGVCMSCSQAHPGCSSCNAVSSSCQVCQSSQLLLNGNCFTECPQGYTSDGTNCKAKTGSDTLTSSLTSSSVFPLPFTITATLIFAGCFISKLQNKNTYVVGTAYALYGFIETGCLCYLLWAYNQYLQTNSPSFNGSLLLLISLCIIIGLNFLSMTVQTYQLVQDQKFSRWLKKKMNYIVFVIVSIVSGLFSYKFKMIVFTRLFGFGCLRAQLQNVHKFRLFNVLSFLGVIHQGIAIYASSLALVELKLEQPLFLIFLDFVIINILNIVLALAASSKDTNFFEQIDGTYKIHKIQNDEQEYEVPAIGGQEGNQQGPKEIQSRNQLLDGSHEEDPFSLSVSEQQSATAVKRPSKFKTYMNNKSDFVKSHFKQEPLQSGNELSRKDGSLDNYSAVYSGELSGIKLKKFQEEHQLSPDILSKVRKSQHIEDIGSEDKIKADQDEPVIVLRNNNIFDSIQGLQDEELPEYQDIVADINPLEQNNLKKQTNIQKPLNINQPNDNNQQIEADLSSKQPTVKQIKVFKGKSSSKGDQPEVIEQIDLTIGKKQLQLIALRKKINKISNRESHSVRQKTQQKDNASDRKGPKSNYTLDMNNLQESQQILERLEKIQLSPARPRNKDAISQNIPENIVEEESKGAFMKKIEASSKNLNNQSSIMDQIKLTYQNKPHSQDSTYQPLQSTIIEQIPHNFAEVPNNQGYNQLDSEIQDFADFHMETFDINKQNPLQPAVESDTIQVQVMNQDNSPGIEYEIENINADFGEDQERISEIRGHNDNLFEQSFETGSSNQRFIKPDARIDPHKLIGQISRSKNRHMARQPNPNQRQQRANSKQKKRSQGKNIYDGNDSFDEEGFIEENDTERSENRRQGKASSRQKSKRQNTQMSGDYQQFNETSTNKGNSSRQITQRRAAPNLPPLHRRPSTSDLSRMPPSGPKKKRAPSNQRKPGKNLSIYQSETEGKNESESNFDRSNVNPSMKSYRSRSIDRDEADQKYLSNSRSKSRKSKGQKDDLDDYYRKKTPGKSKEKSNSKEKERKKSSEKKLRELEKIYLQGLEFRPTSK